MVGTVTVLIVHGDIKYFCVPGIKIKVFDNKDDVVVVSNTLGEKEEYISNYLINRIRLTRMIQWVCWYTMKALKTLEN